MVFYRAIAEGNWKKPLNLSLHSTHDGEIRVPFTHHVRQPNAPPSASFPQFTLLPLELQLRVLNWCEKSTLLQLMHTSRFIRAEANKLFFSDPEAVYWIDAEWLLQGGYPGNTLYDLDFMLHVEHLYIDFFWMTEKNWMNPADWDVYSGTEEEAVVGAYGGMDENVRKFWSTVQHRFPRLKHVTLGDDHDRSSLRETSRVPPIVYRKVGEMCPVGIEVSVALFQGGDRSTNRRMRGRLWRLVTFQADTNTDTKAQWEERSSWYEPLIVMPYKILRGPVGKFQDFYIRQDQQMCQGRAIRVYKIAAVEKYYFDGRHCSFRCSAQGCNTVFKQPEEYTSHVIETRHHQMQPLPEPFKHLFTENDRRLERMAEDLSERRKHLEEWWGPEESSQRQTAEKEIMHQLENDALLYAQDKPVSEHKWMEIIHSFLDETGI